MYKSLNKIQENTIKQAKEIRATVEDLEMEVETIKKTQTERTLGMDHLLVITLLAPGNAFYEKLFLHMQVQAVIRTIVTLLRFLVSPEKPVQNPHPSHPGPLLGYQNVGSTLPLPYAHMPALPSSQGVFSVVSPGMDGHKILDDQRIFDQISDLLMGVGIGDFIGLNCGPTDLPFYYSRGH
uniref:LRRG00131 n=1 Tax=Rattus norvegicus TaxID=10116 RepID=Q6QI77_RAT|nr:LRRG00131 [Rattus norvegicus]